MQPPSAVLLAWGSMDLQHPSSQHAKLTSTLHSPRSPVHVVVHPNAASSWVGAASASNVAGFTPAAHKSFSASSRSSTDSPWQLDRLSRNSIGTQYSTHTSSLRSSVDMPYSSAELKGMAFPRSLDAQRTRCSADLPQMVVAATAAAARVCSASCKHSLIDASAMCRDCEGPSSSTDAAGAWLPHMGNGRSNPGAKEIAHIAKLHRSKDCGTSALPPRGNGRSLPGGRELVHLAHCAATDSS